MLVFFTLVRIVMRAVAGREEIDPAVYLLDLAVRSPESLAYAMYVIVAIAAPAAGFATAWLLRAGGHAWLAGIPVFWCGGIALAAGLAVALGDRLEPVAPFVDAPEPRAAGTFGAILRTWFVSLPYLAAGALAMMATRRLLWAAAAVFALAVVEPLLSSLAPGEIGRFLLNDNLQSIMRLNGTVSAFEDGRGGRASDLIADLPGAGHATIMVGLYVVALSAGVLAMILRSTRRGQANHA